MDSKVVVTYKRKRLFSRRDSYCTNLSSDAPSESSESKTLKKFDNREESTAENVLQNKDIEEFGICHEYSECDVGENPLQCEICDSQCSEKDGTKLQCPFSGCTKQQDSPVSDQNETDTPEQINSSPKSDPKEVAFKPDVVPEGNNKEISNTEEKSSSENILGTVSLEDTIKINKDQRSSSCSNLVTKRKLNSNLITFQRRSKRKNNVSETQPSATSCSVDLQNEKKQPEDIDNSCSFSAPPPETAVIAHVVKSSDIPQETAENAPADVAQPFNKDSQDEILSSLRGDVCKDAENNQNIINVKPENLSNDDVDSTRVPSDASGKKDSLLSLDLSISSHASRDIDCNMPPGPSEVLHDSPPRAVRDKGKSVMESPPTFQLFPESSQTINGHAYSSFYGFPNIQLQQQQQQPREAFHQFLQTNINHAHSFSRQNTMLDNVLNRARAMRGPPPPTTWSEEELDCLWIGVRRHGKGNWDTIRMDPRLNFSPWKTPHDLADRWQQEQARLFSYDNNPVPQAHYVGPTVQLSLRDAAYQYSYEGGSHRRPLLHPMTMNMKQPQEHGRNLPHWLREVVQMPMSSGMRWLNQPSFQCSSEYSQPHQWLNNNMNNNRATNVNAPAFNKKDDVIVITSDASSEETISDDLGGRA